MVSNYWAKKKSLGVSRDKCEELFVGSVTANDSEETEYTLFNGNLAKKNYVLIW
jgi:hypothetical protein